MKNNLTQVTNTGKYPIEFEWTTAKTRLLTIQPQRGVVGKGERVDVKMAFFPVSEAYITDHACNLQIVNGNKYTFGVHSTPSERARERVCVCVFERECVCVRECDR